LFIWLHKIAQYRWFCMENLHITEKNHFLPKLLGGGGAAPPQSQHWGALAPAAPHSLRLWVNVGQHNNTFQNTVSSTVYWK